MSTRQLLPGFALALAFLFLGAGHASAMTPTPTPTMTPTPTPTLADIIVPASAATASTHDGNVPGNTVDHDLQTRWAGYGDGAWLRYDLGSTRLIAQVRIAVYRGNERRNRFDLQTSSDGTTWSYLLANGITSGTTTQEQLFDVPDTQARYIRYLGHGSTVGLWNSVTEIRLVTYGVQPSVTATASKTMVDVGETIQVRAHSNMGLNQFRISIVDKSTGQLEDETNPIFTPARPDPITTSGSDVFWTLTAARKGTVEFRVDSNGELYDPACGCTSFRNASGTSQPVTVGFVYTPTPTPVCVTPTPPPAPAPLNPAVVGGNRYAVVTWQSGSASTGAHKYEVQRSTASGGPWATVATVDVSGTRDGRYADQAVANGTRYFYVVIEIWSWSFNNPPCPPGGGTLTSQRSPEVSTIPGITTGTEITPARAAVTASTDDGNVPGNTVDNNLSTRWSGSGDGATLTLDLGAARTVDYLKIAMYRGDERRNRLEIQLSNDGTTWASVWRGESTGLTLAEEIYDVPDQSARYIRYVGHGATINAGGTSTWNSVTEISVFAP